MVTDLIMHFNLSVSYTSLICKMSLNVTTSNPHNLRKGNILLTDLNDAKKEEQNRRRLMRLEQVSAIS